MYLELCGPIQKKEETYVAKFVHSAYKTDEKNREVPVFCVIEAMNQIVCRTCSQIFYENIPAFPCQISDLSFDAEFKERCTYDNESLFLQTTIENKLDKGIGKCCLIDDEGKALAQGTIWVTKRVASIITD